MKAVLLLLALLSSMNVFAQAGIVFTPTHPAYCDTRDYSMVNRVYDIQKTEEDDKYVTFTYVTEYGPCSKNVIDAHTVKAKWVTIDMLKNEFCLICNEPAKVKWEKVSEKELAVTIKVNKEKAFKNREVMSFGLYYSTGELLRYVSQRDSRGNVQWVPWYLRFIWTVDIYKDENDISAIRIR